MLHPHQYALSLGSFIRSVSASVWGLEESTSRPTAFLVRFAIRHRCFSPELAVTVTVADDWWNVACHTAESAINFESRLNFCDGLLRCLTRYRCCKHALFGFVSRLFADWSTYVEILPVARVIHKVTMQWCASVTRSCDEIMWRDHVMWSCDEIMWWDHGVSLNRLFQGAESLTKAPTRNLPLIKFSSGSFSNFGAQTSGVTRTPVQREFYSMNYTAIRCTHS
jgi:hypothetical protein